MHSTDGQKKIILQTNLKGYFFEGLNALNKKSLCPVPESVIFYSSDVLDKFALSQDFFEVSEGKVREKILGIKLLEAAQMSRDDQRRVYKEVADMSLMVCGYFAESTHKKKLVDTHYYSQIGKMAFSQLDSIAPRFLDIPSFYSMVATCFGQLTTLMTTFATTNNSQGENPLFSKILRGEKVSEEERLVNGIVLIDNAKAC